MARLWREACSASSPGAAQGTFGMVVFWFSFGICGYVDLCFDRIFGVETLTSIFSGDDQINFGLQKQRAVSSSMEQVADDRGLPRSAHKKHLLYRVSTFHRVAMSLQCEFTSRRSTPLSTRAWRVSCIQQVFELALPQRSITIERFTLRKGCGACPNVLLKPKIHKNRTSNCRLAFHKVTTCWKLQHNEA